MPGQLLGDRYEVEKQLGKQSGRWTLLARDLVTQDPVILKVLCIDEEMLADDLMLFQREIETLQTLEHPDTPKYLGYFEIELPKAGKAIVLLQSYIAGQSLQTYLAEGRVFSEPEARQIAGAILPILTYLHNHQPAIIHRDIKPSNILLTGSPDQPTAGQICLIDFGSVRLSTTLPMDQTTTTIVGSDGYIPPEQIGRRAVNASDLYGLGVTLISSLTGLPATQLPRQGIQIDVRRSVDCSPAFTQWLCQMTDVELYRRFSTAEAALEALLALE
ncbi:MAG: serine/threonine protein kinase [Elainella sp. Prado103]|jgi:serine/threonine protein kinase|nr:serine/threonine protein kinase [Elainella sp. Prado103]